MTIGHLNVASGTEEFLILFNAIEFKSKIGYFIYLPEKFQSLFRTTALCKSASSIVGFINSKC